MARDGATREEALARIRSQKPVAEKVAVADFVIDTDGPVEESARRTREVLAGVCAKVGVEAGRYLGG
jgi:dephospho-CoA kinase